MNTLALISCKCRLIIMLAASPIPLPFFALAAPASIIISLHLQLMRATVLAESSCFYLFSLDFVYSMAVCRHESDRCCTFLPLLTYVNIIIICTLDIAFKHILRTFFCTFSFICLILGLLELHIRKH
jgi:hypothetical protein